MKISMLGTGIKEDVHSYILDTRHLVDGLGLHINDSPSFKRTKRVKAGKPKRRPSRRQRTKSARRNK